MTTKKISKKKVAKKVKKKNPLYAVNKKEGIVEEACGWLDLIVKKLNLEPVIAMLNQLFQMLLENVKNYSMFVEVKKFIDGAIEQVLMLMGTLSKS